MTLPRVTFEEILQEAYALDQALSPTDRELRELPANKAPKTARDDEIPKNLAEKELIELPGDKLASKPLANRAVPKPQAEKEVLKLLAEEEVPKSPAGNFISKPQVDFFLCSFGIKS